LWTADRGGARGWPLGRMVTPRAVASTVAFWGRGPVGEGCPFSNGPVNESFRTLTLQGDRRGEVWNGTTLKLTAA